jgi:hypothetical protein
MRKIPTDVQLRTDQLDAIDEKVENRLKYIRELIDDDLGLEVEA